ncbi:MAG: hypothetical protein R3D43_10995 [Tepidamorphaceae bacterium]
MHVFGFLNLAYSEGHQQRVRTILRMCMLSSLTSTEIRLKSIFPSADRCNSQRIPKTHRRGNHGILMLHDAIAIR